MNWSFRTMGWFSSSTFENYIWSCEKWISREATKIPWSMLLLTRLRMLLPNKVKGKEDMRENWWHLRKRATIRLSHLDRLARSVGNIFGLHKMTTTAYVAPQGHWSPNNIGDKWPLCIFLIPVSSMRTKTTFDYHTVDWRPKNKLTLRDCLVRKFR